MSLTNGMPDFPPHDRTARRPNRLKPQQRTSKPFHGSVVLLDEIIEIFGVPVHDGRLVNLIGVVNRCRVAPTLIDRNLPGVSQFGSYSLLYRTTEFNPVHVSSNV